MNEEITISILEILKGKKIIEAQDILAALFGRIEILCVLDSDKDKAIDSLYIEKVISRHTSPSTERTGATKMSV